VVDFARPFNPLRGHVMRCAHHAFAGLRDVRRGGGSYPLLREARRNITGSPEDNEFPRP
jgi:hypothetical protein